MVYTIVGVLRRAARKETNQEHSRRDNGSLFKTERSSWAIRVSYFVNKFRKLGFIDYNGSFSL